ncbi:MAG TPA: hypothetical protein VEO00_04015, partial [Actinomycetota bacterium]|nr:hypothetical protein [Actinomycetota bacterium]
AGRLVQVAEDGRTTAYADTQTLLTARTDPAGGTAFAYDSAGGTGLLASVTDPFTAQATTYQYDAGGRPYRRIDASGLTTTRTYDGAGRIDGQTVLRTRTPTRWRTSAWSATWPGTLPRRTPSSRAPGPRTGPGPIQDAFASLRDEEAQPLSREWSSPLERPRFLLRTSSPALAGPTSLVAEPTAAEELQTVSKRDWSKRRSALIP